MSDMKIPDGVQIAGEVTPAFAEILNTEALAFVAQLARKFEERRQKLLKRRATRQKAFDEGAVPVFWPETKHIRDGDWTVAPLPEDLQDRRVEITGPTDRKMIINALNSGATMFMADFEDSNAPAWRNMIEGQINLRDAIMGTISFTSPEGKQYRLNEKVATLLVRPRGWHLPEKHMLVDDKAVSGSLFDFGLYFFHNAKNLIAKGTGPYFYLPKLETHLEARLWNDVFNFAQDELKIPRGTIKATVLIETILGAFEMDEILYELRDHSAGLNCGRWDYLFSAIKTFHARRDFVLADRALVTMTAPFMRAYAQLVIKTCHQRNAPAIGGMAAQIPIKGDAAANEAALAKVRADKEREATDGHDGTWVAHPGLVTIAREIFDRIMPTPNQIHKKRDDVHVTDSDLLAFGPEKPITEAGLRKNIEVGVRYLAAWLAHNGCVPIHHLMEDAATAEISRAQIWQWIRSPKGVLEDGRKVTKEMFRTFLPEELTKVRAELGSGYDENIFSEAAELFEEITTDDKFTEFLTLPAYERLN
ncbi:MAG TPA: malate synthase A [Burkholderiales bacterium]|nr:malate synthase A [Burkholderiales bacterium]